MNPRIAFRRLRDFQSRSFGRSDTSPRPAQTSASTLGPLSPRATWRARQTTVRGQRAEEGARGETRGSPAFTEGEGFEPSIRLTTDNGFRDGTTSAQPWGFPRVRARTRASLRSPAEDKWPVSNILNLLLERSEETPSRGIADGGREFGMLQYEWGDCRKALGLAGVPLNVFVLGRRGGRVQAKGLIEEVRDSGMRAVVAGDREVELPENGFELVLRGLGSEHLVLELAGQVSDVPWRAGRSATQPVCIRVSE